MNREIKFRAWDTKDKEITHFSFTNNLVCKYDKDDLHICSDSGGWDFYRKSVKIMQYTGVKDKKGKDIYEGDILRVDNNLSIDTYVRGEIGEVKFIPSRFTLCCKNEFMKMLTTDFEDCVEVIGNIYENPKLLKK